MRSGTLALAGLVLALGAACASQSVETEWERVESPHYVAEDGSFALELPVGWMRSGGVLARDPDGAHAISFNAGPVLTGEDAIAVDASAPELVQAVSEQLAAQPGVRVLDCRAAALDGASGFRVHFVREPEPEAGAEAEADDAPPLPRSEHLLYSVIDGEMLYAFSLEAPAGEEFALDVPEFEELVASFRRLPAER